MSAHDRAPLVIAPTHVKGLLEFSRACPDDHEPCADGVEFASRAELQAMLRAAQTRDVRTPGGTWVDWDDVKLMLAQLDRYDAGRVA